VEAGAQALVSAAESVAVRLGLDGEAFTFVLSGGMFRGVPLLVDEVTRRLPAVAPRAEVRPLAGEPAEGAVRLALAETRGGALVPAYVSI